MNINSYELKLANLANGSQETTKKNTTSSKPGGNNAFSKIMRDYTGSSNGNQEKTSEVNTVDKANGTSQELPAANKVQTLKKAVELLEKFGLTSDIKPEEGDSVTDDEQLSQLIAQLLGSLNSMLKDQSLENETNTSAVTTAKEGESKDSLGVYLNAVLEKIKATVNSKDNPMANIKKGIEALNSLVSKMDLPTNGDNVKNLKELAELLSTKLNPGNYDAGDKSTANNPKLRDSINELLGKLNTVLDKLQKNDSNEKMPLTNEIQTVLLQLQSNLKALQTTSEVTSSASNKQSKTASNLEPKNVVMDMSNNLNSIIDMVKAKLKADTSGNTEKDLRTAFEELLSGVDLNKVNAENVSQKNPASPNIDKASLMATEDNLKKNLVGLLVLLSKDSIEKNSKSNQAGAVKRFAQLVNKELKTGDVKEEAIKTNEAKDAGIKLSDNLTKGQETKAQNVSVEKDDASVSKQSKEDKILSSVIGKDEDGKTNKVNTFIAHLNSSKGEVQTSEAGEKPVVNRATFTQDIIKTVKFMNANDLKELTVKIAPRDLGEITIKLTMDAGNMKANISANNKETYGLLSTHLKDLASALNGNDIKIQNVDINVYQDDTTFFNENFSRGNGNGGGDTGRNGNSRHEGFSELIEEEISEKNSDGNISALV